ncbi:hypothetical protein [Trichormus azollae]|nr:hypothetical protein [Trichormus azollae]
MNPTVFKSALLYQVSIKVSSIFIVLEITANRFLSVAAACQLLLVN